MGHPGAFCLALLLVIGWAASGPLFDFGSTWQLVINTFTTILTFLMVFLLQNSQNRDSEAVQLKLDELIRALEGARNSMVAIEQLDEEEFARLQKKFEALAARARQRESPGATNVGADASSHPQSSEATSP